MSALLLLALALVNQGTGSERLRFRHITMNDGLSQSSVYSMVQDDYGFLWLGTQDGLNRWDGYNFMGFRRDGDNPQTLSDNFVHSLLLDAEHRLWAGTNNGISLLGDSGFQNYFLPLGQDGDPAGNRVFCMTNDGQGRIWLGTGAGLLRFSPPPPNEEPEFETFVSSNNENSLFSNRIRTLFSDHLGRVWVGTTGGLTRYDEEAGHFIRFSPASMGRLSVDTMVQDDKGRLWLGTPGGLFRLDPETGEANEIALFPSTDKTGRIPIPSLLIDRSGILWVGTRGQGLLRMKTPAGETTAGEAPTFVQYTHDPRNPDSLSHPSITGLFEDRFGSIWAATIASGLNVFSAKGEPFQIISKQSIGYARLSGDIVLSVLRDSRDIFWAGVLGDGLNQLPYKNLDTDTNFRVVRFNASEGRADIRHIFEDANNHLWFATRGMGVFYLPAENALDPQQQHFLNIIDDGRSTSSLGENYIRFIFQDREGGLWFGTDRRGLSRMITPYPGESPRFQQFRPNGAEPESGPSTSEIRSMVADPNHSNVYWVGCFGGGVSRMTLQNGTPRFKHFRHAGETETHSSQDLTRCLLAWKDRLWVGSNGGLSALPLNAESPQFRNWLMADGLPNETIYALVPDSEGYLWLSTNNGVSRFNPEKEIFRNFTQVDGLQGNEFNSASVFLDHEGQIYFGGVNGVNIFTPTMIKDNNYIPRTVLTDISVFNRRVSIITQKDKAQLKLSTSLAYAPFIPSLPGGDLPELVVDHHQNMLSFSFAGLNFPNASKTRHQYFLEGFDTAWLDADAINRRATYTNLDPGPYTFRVKSAGESDLWDPVGASLKIHVLPPPWRRPLAYAFYIIAILAGIISYIWRQQVMRDRLRFLVQERTLQLEVANMRLTRQNDDIRKAQRQLIVQNKMASMVRLTKGIAHELRNPLNFVNNFAEVAVKTGKDARESLEEYKNRPDPETLTDVGDLVEDLMQSSQLISQHGRRMERIVSGMMNMGEPESQTTAADDINFLVKQAASLVCYGLSGEAPPFQIHLNLEERQTPLTLSAQGISRVLMNLLNNAREAVIQKLETGEPRYEPEIRVTVRDDGKNLVVTVWDNGPGIPETHREHIFEPFFTHNRDEEHVGLGLYTSYEIIVREHQGQLNMKTEEGAYTEMEVILPH